MAADTRPYKSKEQDGQGNELIIRDQQLVEQASQTTMASGEYFEIVDVDGRMAKIPKANMVDIVREALGSLLNGLSDQTTVTKVPSLNGNTLGASTVATLASVLGVIIAYPTTQYIANCKTQVHAGVYGLGEDSLNAPFRYGVVVAFPHTNNNDQIKFALNVSSGHRLAFMIGNGDWWYFDDLSA